MSLPSLFLRFSVSAHFPSKQPIFPSQLPSVSAQERACSRGGGGLQICDPNHAPLYLGFFPCYRHGKRPCPQGTPGSTPGQCRQLTYTLKNGLKIRPPLHKSPRVLLLALLGEIEIPQGSDAPASLVPGTGCWDGSEMAAGGGARHFSPFSPSVLQPCRVAKTLGGAEGCWGGGVWQCRRSLAIGWGLATQRGILQRRRGACSLRGCLAMQGVVF